MGCSRSRGSLPSGLMSILEGLAIDTQAHTHARQAGNLEPRSLSRAPRISHHYWLEDKTRDGLRTRYLSGWYHKWISECDWEWQGRTSTPYNGRVRFRSIVRLRGRGRGRGLK